MALSGNTVFEVRPGGSDTNGGGFVTGASGTDRSQQTAAWATLTTASTVGTNTTWLMVSATDYTVTTADVGNLVQISGGTATAGVYQITAVDVPTNRWSLDRALGTTGQTAPGNMGGALATPGGAGLIVAANAVAGITVFIQYSATPYSITSTTANVSGGLVTPPSNTYWVGYDLSRTKWPAPGGNRPTIQLQSGLGSSLIMFAGTNNTYFLQNVILDCNSNTLCRAGVMSGEYFYVKAINGNWNTTGGVLQDNSAGRAILCEVTGCTTTGGAAALKMSGSVYYCVVHDNTVAANTSAARIGPLALCCIVYNITTGMGLSAAVAVNCVAYNCAQGGFFPGNNNCTFINCIAENNGTYGWSGGTGRTALIKCSSYNNTSSRYNAGTGAIFDIDPITASSSVFTNAAAADFTLNNTAGAGALCRATGFPTSFPHNGMLDYSDVGAAQHQDTGGGGTGISRARGASGF